MEQFEGQKIIVFMNAFPDGDACKAYLADLRWKDGFRCSKCGHNSGRKRKGHSYFCYRCDHMESPSAGTLFHKI